MLPVPEGILNPLWLAAWAESSLTRGRTPNPDTPRPSPLPEPTPIGATSISEDTTMTIRPPAADGVVVPRLSRISSDCDAEGDPPARLETSVEYEAVRKEFERSFVDGPPPSSRRTRHLSHHGYFRRQIQSQADVFIPLDPDEDSPGTVVIDKDTASIYDVYLLRVDISKNANSFIRRQVVFCPDLQIYTLYTRHGRVGLPGKVSKRPSLDLKSLIGEFLNTFRQSTGVNWSQRYERRSGQGEGYHFVELDYRDRAAVPPIKEPYRHYEAVDSRMPESVGGLLEVMLYPSSATEEAGTTATRSPYTAPYEHLSPWTWFLGFKVLQRIYQYLKSGTPVRWKSLMRASSTYRSHIPLHTGHGRLPVISSYHALFLELKFIYHFWPQATVAILMSDVHLHNSLQLSQYGSVSQPLYHAYSSLRHGFKRLTSPETTEFCELKGYLEKSCHRQHHMKIELQDIYSVFIKSKLPNPYHKWIDSKHSHGSDERLLLWHGTPLDSLLGILDLGLQIRRKGSTFTGAMFGDGIYFADASSKSANYCREEDWSGEGVLLLCEVDVGQHRIRRRGSMPNGHEVIQASAGRIRCIQGLGKIQPAKWKDVSWEMTGAPSMGVVCMVCRPRLSLVQLLLD